MHRQALMLHLINVTSQFLVTIITSHNKIRTNHTEHLPCVCMHVCVETNEGCLEKGPPFSNTHPSLWSDQKEMLRHTHSSTHTYTFVSSHWWLETLCPLWGIITLDDSDSMIKARPGRVKERKKERKRSLTYWTLGTRRLVCTTYITLPLSHVWNILASNVVMFMFRVWIHVHITVCPENVCLTGQSPFVFNLRWEGRTQTERPVITRRGLLSSAQHPHLHNGFQLLVKTQHHGKPGQANGHQNLLQSDWLAGHT